MQINRTVEIEAPRALAWAALVDVQNWPLWTESTITIERLDDGPFGPDSLVRITQLNAPAITWRVVAIEPGTSFAWESAGLGVTTLASHRVKATVDGKCAVTLEVTQSGPMTRVTGRATLEQMRRYVDMMADSLKRYCESSK